MTAAAAKTTDWASVAFATGPADRARAEAGIADAYTGAGLAAPERVVWLPSPAHGTVAAALLAGHTLDAPELGDLVEPVRAALGDADPGAGVRDAVRTRPWESARTAACADLGPQRWPQVWAQTGGPLWDQVNSLVTRMRHAIGAVGGDAHEALLRAATLDAVLGQHDAPWLATFDSLGMLDGPLSGLAEVARHAGWWWPYERLVVATERPTELHRDEPGRLHRGDGPALAYESGLALYAWRGMPVPADFIESLADLDHRRILQEENAELRRVMLEVFGYDRYLAESGAEPVHRDETGVLWRIDLPGDEPVVMVEVVNSTPEPDGSFRTYYLRVPPHVRTAREGVAWTFGLDEADYRPERET